MPSNIECQKDPIFLLQKRVYQVTKLPDWMNYDGGDFVVNSNYLDDPEISDKVETFLDEHLAYVEDYNKMCEFLINYEGDGDCAYCIETWNTESVWLKREEAEDYAKGVEYNYPEGWRVYCVSAKGSLSTII